MLSKRYHLIAEGSDADSLKALRLLEDFGLEYVLTLVDGCPDYFYHLKDQHQLDKLPLIFEYGERDFFNFKLIGGLQEFLSHMEELFE